MPEIIMRAPVGRGPVRPADKIVVKSIALEPRSKYPPESALAGSDIKLSSGAAKIQIMSSVVFEPSSSS